MRVLEGSSARLTIRFLDEDGVLAAPDSVEYRLDVKDTGEQIRDWTVLAPASSIVVVLTDEDNDSFVVTQELERHEVTVRAAYDVTEQLTGKFVYEVRNLRFLV